MGPLYCLAASGGGDMVQTNRKLLLLTSGGDAPGMNSAIRSVVRTACYHGMRVFACHDGYHGLVEQAIFPMAPSDVSGCIQLGGTILRSGRSKSFRQLEVRQRVAAFLKDEGIGYLVAIGGDGTFRGAALLEQLGDIKTIGIPGTIDNDIVGTEYTIGFDTARNNAVRALDKIRDTSASSGLNFLVEIMGRRAGFLALDVGISAGAEYILVPEYPIEVSKLAEGIMHPARPKRSVIIVVSEADCPGRSFGIADELRGMTPGHEYRVCVLGHAQRGGMPTAQDRVVASIMGNMAVEGLLAGKSNCMVAFQNGSYLFAPLPDPDLPARSLSSQELLKLNEVLAI